MARSIRTAVPAAIIVVMLSAAPSYAAGRNRDQENTRSAVQRVVQIVKRLFGAAPHDSIIIPNP
jgi:hypothetical protein